MTFKKGETTNPDGRNGQLKGYQRYGDRVVELLRRYTAGDVLDLYGDPKAFRKLPVRDGQIIKQIAETLMGTDSRLERETMLDRIEGKADASVSIKHSGIIAHEHEAVPASLGWLREITGKDAPSPTTEPLLH